MSFLSTFLALAKKSSKEVKYTCGLGHEVRVYYRIDGKKFCPYCVGRRLAHLLDGCGVLED